MFRILWIKKLFLKEEDIFSLRYSWFTMFQVYRKWSAIYVYIYTHKDFSIVHTVKNLPAMQETQVWFLCREDPLEKGMATDSSILSWKIPWTEEPGGLVCGVAELDTTEWLNHHPTHTCVYVCAYIYIYIFFFRFLFTIGYYKILVIR